MCGVAMLFAGTRKNNNFFKMTSHNVCEVILKLEAQMSLTVSRHSFNIGPYGKIV
jgi:hypothetical protein